MESVKFEVDSGRISGELRHAWRYIGYDECNYTQTPEGQELISRFGRLEDAPYYIRTHHLLCTGNCHGTPKWGSTNVYTEDRDGNPVYRWETLDEILDIILRNNCRPFFEIGFMPMDLVDPRYASWERGSWQAYGRYKEMGWACPPKDYRKWGDLVSAILEHCMQRYGREEVLAWYWELWNEPDIFYWRGTKEEFCRLYDYTEAAVHAVLPEARLGGPATTDPIPGAYSLEFLEFFLDHCARGRNECSGGTGTRLDYVSFHTKGGGFPFAIDAEKSLPSVDKLVRQVRDGLEAVKKHGYGDREVVLSEADPDGWAAGGTRDNVNLNFRNTEYYASYVASSYGNIERTAKSMGMDVRPIAWAFLFVGERCFEGTRTFSTQGICKAIFNLFKMYAGMGDRSLSFEGLGDYDVASREGDSGPREGPELSGRAAISRDGSVQIMVYSHHEDWDFERETEVEVELVDCPFRENVLVRHYRIDNERSNAYAEWLRQGKPDYPLPEQFEAIQRREGLELLEPEKILPLSDGRLSLRFSMPAHAVSLIKLSRA